MLCYIDGISWFQIALQEKPLLSTIMQSRQPFHWATNLHIQPHKHIQTSHITREIWLCKAELWSELEFLYFPIPTRLDPVPVTFQSRPGPVPVSSQSRLSPKSCPRRISAKLFSWLSAGCLEDIWWASRGSNRKEGIRDWDRASQGFGTWTGPERFWERDRWADNSELKTAGLK